MNPIFKNLMTIRKQIVAEWDVELSAKVGRPVDDLLNKGLNAGDFPLNQELKIKFEDGSTACFRHAFFVESASKGAVAVFTEHCGYFVIARSGLEMIQSSHSYYCFHEEEP